MTTPQLERSNIVDFIADIFERRGAESYLGEPVTMSQHMLQGAVLAEREGAPDELVAAALLHDIGHYTSEFGPYSPEDTEDNHHDEAGAKVLEHFFPPVVVECVRLHVAAKRYLTNEYTGSSELDENGTPYAELGGGHRVELVHQGVVGLRTQFAVTNVGFQAQFSPAVQNYTLSLGFEF